MEVTTYQQTAISGSATSTCAWGVISVIRAISDNVWPRKVAEILNMNTLVKMKRVCECDVEMMMGDFWFLVVINEVEYTTTVYTDTYTRYYHRYSNLTLFVVGGKTRRVAVGESE